MKGSNVIWKMMEKYVYREYDEKCPVIFQREKALLQQILGLEVVIEHVGSTAIYGLGGKGIIDILVGTSDSDFERVIDALSRSGYAYSLKASTDKRKFLKMTNEEGEEIRVIHIHVTRFQGEEWNNMTRFRDALRQDQSLKKEYAQLKKTAASIARGDGKKYRHLKNDFIERVIYGNLN